MKSNGLKKDTEKTEARVASFRFKVVKNGVVLGGHTVRASAQKLADQLGGTVEDARRKK